MDAELIRIRRNKGLDIRMADKVAMLDQEKMNDKCHILNENTAYLYSVEANPSITMEEYINKIVENIYIILEIFSDMGVYPDYFYDIFFRMMDRYYSLASQGKTSVRIEPYKDTDFLLRVSGAMENGLKVGNYQINPTKVRDIGEYYNEMVDFMQRHYLPYEVTTIEMCHTMFADIRIDVNNGINNPPNNGVYVSDYAESLSKVLFLYLRFFAAIGINPKRYLDREINRKLEERDNKKETRKSR